RTGWFRWRSPPPANLASPGSPARRRETSRIRLPLTPHESGWIPLCSSHPISNRRRSPRPLSTAESSSRSRVPTTTSTGCAASSPAFENGTDVVLPVKPTGIAKSLNIGNPADGPYALDAVRASGGAMAHVSDDEIRDGIQLLAETTGVFAETAGGVTTAVLKK